MQLFFDIGPKLLAGHFSETTPHCKNHIKDLLRSPERDVSFIWMGAKLARKIERGQSWLSTWPGLLAVLSHQRMEQVSQFLDLDSPIFIFRASWQRNKANSEIICLPSALLYCLETLDNKDICTQTDTGNILLCRIHTIGSIIKSFIWTCLYRVKWFQTPLFFCGKYSKLFYVLLNSHISGFICHSDSLALNETGLTTTKDNIRGLSVCGSVCPDPCPANRFAARGSK